MTPALRRCFNRGRAGEVADYSKAIESARAIEINPRHAAAYNSRSNAFEATGNLDRAIADHRKAIEITRAKPSRVGGGTVEVSASMPGVDPC